MSVKGVCVVIKKPITFKIHRGFDWFSLSSKEYDLYPIGDTWYEVFNDLHGRILAKIDFYRIEKKHKGFSGNSKFFRKNFLKAFELV